MLPISILQKTDTSILYEIPAGKPDPKQTCMADEESRDRVLQTGQKSADCSYYTFNLLRRRIGKNPCTKLENERKIEKFCSERRKELMCHDVAFPISIAELYSETDIIPLQLMDVKNAQKFLKNQTASDREVCAKDYRASSLKPYVEEFIKEKKFNNMHEFLIYKRSYRSIEINMKFLDKFSTGIEKMFEHKNWEGFDYERKAAAIDAFVRDFSAVLYKLHKSSWKPQQGIDKLIDELKKNGPLMVGGDLGESSYIDPPYKMREKVGDRDIYAWYQGATRNALKAGHCVLLVGAKKIQDKAFAYFIDPTDPSDPTDRSKQKIYMISFTNLTSHIYDLAGIKREDSPIEYAYYGNFKI